MEPRGATLRSGECEQGQEGPVRIKKQRACLNQLFCYRPLVAWVPPEFLSPAQAGIDVECNDMLMRLDASPPRSPLYAQVPPWLRSLGSEFSFGAT